MAGEEGTRDASWAAASETSRRTWFAKEPPLRATRPSAAGGGPSILRPCSLAPKRVRKKPPPPPPGFRSAKPCSGT